MAARPLAGLVAGAALSACALQLPQVSTDTYRAVPSNDVLTTDASATAPVPDVEQLLTYRSRACAHGEAEREHLLRDLQADHSDEATLKILMLGTCVPDQTPGLLANYLAKARAMDHDADGRTDLLALLSAQLRSYSLVEQRLREVEGRLERLITGLREIEAEMGGGAEGAW